MEAIGGCKQGGDLCVFCKIAPAAMEESKSEGAGEEVGSTMRRSLGRKT